MPSLPLIRLEGVYKSFGETQVLRGADLTIERGSTTVILGMSGSGKTVLLKLMIGLLQPDQGRVWVEGKDLAQLDAEELQHVRERFGMVFQGAALFDGMTVFENVAFPLRERRHLSKAQLEVRVRRVLDLFDLRGIDDEMPEALSGGMRTRLAVARAMVLEPEIAVYDEPTTGLDPLLTESVVQEIIHTRTRLGVTSIVVCADIAAAFEMADHLAFLDQGRIIAAGSPAEMLRSPQPDVHRFLAQWERDHDGPPSETSTGDSNGHLA